MSSWSWIIAGASVGLVYVLFSTGFNLMFGVMKCLNVAHAASFVAAALVSCRLSHVNLDASLLLPTLILTAVATGVVLSLITQFLAIEPLLRGGTAKLNIEMATFLTTLGAMFIIESALLQWTNAQPLNFNAELLQIGSTRFLDLTIPNKYFVVGLGSLVSVAAVLLMLRTKTGRYMRATAANRSLAAVMGINVRSTQRIVVILAGALAGIAGLLIAYLYGQASYGLGHSFLLKAIVIGIVGGLGSLTGAAVVAIGLGVVEAGAVHFFGGAWQDLTAFTLVIVVLAVRPQGLFGKAERAQT